MKFAFESEDSIVGIIVGLVLIGMSGNFFTLPAFPYDTFVWGLLFLGSLLFTVLDVRHTLTDMKGHPLMLIGLFVNNVIDFVVEIAMAGMFLGFSVPYISQFMIPYLTDR